MKIYRFVACVLCAMFLVLLPGFSCAFERQGTTYYVSSTGNDANSGRSSTAAWQTLTPVNATTFKPGDRILLEGGQQFQGTLKIQGTGRFRRPIVFSSYGNGRATIASGAEMGAFISTAYIELRNLNFVGDRVESGTHYGIYLNNDTDHQLGGIQIDHVDVSNYGEYGIFIMGSSGNHGFSHLGLTHVSSHDNRNDGIRVRGTWNQPEKVYSHFNLYIADCRVYNNSGYDTENSSGNGLMMSDVDGAVIERCEAYNNGYGWGGRGGGPVGIWSWDSHNVIIQLSESHHNRNGAGRYDGGGFDIDGGDTDSIIQYCYSHDNEGPGYFLAHFAGSASTHKNIIRYNISQNDAQATVQGALNFWSGDRGALTDNWVYHNVIVGNEATTAVVMRESSGANNLVINNVFLAAPGQPLLRSADSTDINYLGNLYWSQGNPLKIEWGDREYSHLAEWRLTTQQEMWAETPVGQEADPMLLNPGGGRTIGNPAQLTTLDMYRLQSGSPLVNAALDLQQLFDHDPGPYDFYGTPIPQNSAYDIGAHELRR